MKYPSLITPVVLALCGTALADDSQKIAMTESSDAGLFDLFGRRIEPSSQNVDGTMPEGVMEVPPAPIKKTSPETPKVAASPSPAMVASPMAKTAAAPMVVASAVVRPRTPVTASTAVKPKTSAVASPQIAAAPTPPLAPKIPQNAHAISWTQRYYTDVNSGATGATHVIKSGNRVMLRSFGQ